MDDLFYEIQNESLFLYGVRINQFIMRKNMILAMLVTAWLSQGVVVPDSENTETDSDEDEMPDEL